MTRPEVHLVGGTRPEAVKLAPIVAAMRAAGLVEPVFAATSRHPALVRRALAAFDLAPDVTLPAEPGTADEGQLLTGMIRRLDGLWAGRHPAAVVVQGNSTTSLAGTLAAHWRRVPVVHVEAGLRSGDLESPFPEAANRRLVAQLAALHLAPTPLAAMNLIDEGLPAHTVLISGNTVVDATLAVARRKLPYENTAVAAARAASHGRRLILVTADRRELWGAPLERIVQAVRALMLRYPDVEVVLPAHPAVRTQAERVLGDVERITVTGPLSYPDRSRLLSEAYLAVTDSGGIQEEAPSFGVPALVLREVTERVELLQAGCARLVGSDTDLIVKEASVLLDDRRRRDAMTAGGNPYGDGLAAARAAQATAAVLGLGPLPEPMPTVTELTDTTPEVHA
jgi:UDP-N-acetylglucosamine 2-epimerase (non-hydrolysing)